ncbi:MAG: energy transducer TonB [Nitrosomonadaceae bacterium]|nr:energy transducer TonB [Nitrosomonadaceae bacterium]|tara:strand:+ start:20715 stop:21614 length:900 start_codon:yes stop_codon:yes gene_type:complete
MTQFILALLRGWLLNPSSRLNLAILISLTVHTFIVFGITFRLPETINNKEAMPLEVVLVNKKSKSEPIKADSMAQANLDGGGNTNKDRRAKTPFPLFPLNKQSADILKAKQRTKQLELEAKKLMAAVNRKKKILQPKSRKEKSEKEEKNLSAADLLQRSREIIRLEAQIAKDHETYQKRPKRKYIGARTKEYRFARYVEDWRTKVERIGNLNYPEAAKKDRLYGTLVLTVGIMANGSIESIEINRSSGNKVLDQAAINIVKLAGQSGFSPFPPDISIDTDILHITRTWMFTRSDALTSK